MKWLTGTRDMMARATKANLQQIRVILDDRTTQDGSMR
jgi:hypothetical protein